MNVNCTEINTINQFKIRVFIFYLCWQRVIQQLFKKTVLGLDESKNRTILADFDIEDGINSKDMPLLVVEVDFQEESTEDLSLTSGKWSII